MAPGAGYGALLDALRGLRWPARAAVRGSTAGSHPARMVGTSPEFTEYRPYRQGEDPRRLDWKLLARTDRAYLRITTDRALLGTIVLLDASASMAFPVPGRAKWVRACELAVGLLSVAQSAADPIGLAVAAEGGPRLLSPRTRRTALTDVIRTLDAGEPAGSPALAPVLAAIPRTRRVAIVSDFLADDADALLRLAAARAREGAEIHAVHVVAAEELHPDPQAAVAYDPEQPALRRPLGRDARIAYDATFTAWRSDLARAWRAVGAGFHSVRTDEPAARAVRRIVARESVEPVR
jgi:uncharacterized protein (DUF58 family)